MNVAIVIKINYNALISTSYCINMLKFFSKHFNVTLLTNATSFFKKQGVNAQYIDLSYLPFPSLSQSVINDRIINQKLKKVEYDLLVVWYDSLYSFPLEKPVLRFVDVCPYQTFGYSKKEDRLRFDQKLSFKMLIDSFRKSSFIITVSPQMKQFLIDYGIPEHTIRWLPFGVDLARYNVRSFLNAQKEHTVINTGPFFSVRGGDMILNAMKLLREQDESITYASLGNSEREFEQWTPLIENMGLENHIKLYGIVDHSKIPEFLAKANIGISILEKNEYYNKSPPQKIFEYMAVGLPTIANDIPTHTDYIKDGYNGFIITSAEEMAEAILTLTYDKTRYKQLSENAKTSAQKYGLEKVQSQLKEDVDALLQV